MAADRMTPLKRVILVATGIFALLIVSSLGFLAFAGDDFYRWATRQIVHDSFGREIHFDGKFDVQIGLSPILEAADIWLENPPWAEGPALLRIGQAKVQIDLWALLKGHVVIPRLEVQRAELNLEVSADKRRNWLPGDGAAVPGAGKARSDVDFPVLGIVSLRQVSLRYRDPAAQDTLNITLDALEKKRLANSQKSELRGSGNMNGHKFQLDGSFGSAANGSDLPAPFPFEANLQAAGFNAQMSGRVQDIMELKGLDVALSLQIPDLAGLPVLRAEGWRKSGRLDLSAKFAGDFNRLSVKELSLKVQDKGGSRFEAAGSIADLWRGSGLKLKFSALVAKGTRLIEQVDMVKRLVASAQATGEITGSLENLRIGNFQGQIAHIDNAKTTITGDATVKSSISGLKILQATAGLEFTTDDTAALVRLFDQNGKSIGPLTGKLAIEFDGTRLRLKSSEIAAKKLAGLRLEASGDLARLGAGNSGTSWSPDLQVRLSAGSNKPIADVIGLALPEIGPLSISGNLRRGDAGFEVVGIKSVFGDKSDFFMGVTGALGPFELASGEFDPKLRGQLRLEWKTSQALTRLAALEVPELGPGKGRIDFEGRLSKLKVDLIEITNQGPGGLIRRVRGRIASLSPTAPAKLSGLDIEAEIRSASEREKPIVSLHLAGRVDDILTFAGLDFTLALGIADTAGLHEIWAIDGLPGGALEGSARLVGDLRHIAMDDLSLVYRGPDDSEYRLEGRIGDLWHGNKLKLAFAADRPKGFPVTGDGASGAKNTGPAHASGDISGSLEELRITNFTGRINHGGDQKTRILGLATIKASLEEAMIKAVSAEATFTSVEAGAWLRLFDQKAMKLGPLNGKLKLSYHDRQIELNSLAVSLKNLGALQLKGKGVLARFAADKKPLNWSPKLQVELSASSSRPILKLMGSNLAELGPMSIAANLLKTGDGFSLQKIDGTLGDRKILRIKSAGAIGPVDLSQATFDPKFKGKLQLAWSSSKRLLQLLGMDTKNLAALGSGDGELTVQGKLSRFSLQAIKLNARIADGIEAHAVGQIASLSMMPKFSLSGLSADVVLNAASVRKLSNIVGRELPDIGPVNAKARVEQTAKSFTMKNIDLVVGTRAKAKFRTTGKIHDLAGLRGIDLSNQFKFPVSDLFKPAGKFELSKLGHLEGGFRFLDKKGSWQVEKFRAKIEGSNLLQLSLGGTGDTIINERKFQTGVKLRIPDLSAIARAFHSTAPPMPVKFDGRISGSAALIRFKGEAGTGKTTFSIDLESAPGAKRAKLAGSIRSALLHIGDFKGPRKSSRSAAAAKLAPVGKLFNTNKIDFEPLKQLDLNLDIEFDKIALESETIGRLTSKINLSRGLLRIAPFAINFVKGNARGTAQVDARTPVPKLALKMEMSNVDFGKMLKRFEVGSPLEGEFDLFADLSASGVSSRQIARNLNGNIGFAINSGRINSAYVGLTVLGIFDFLLAKSTRKGYAELKCLLVQFQVKNGLAVSKTMFLDTPDMVAEGTGQVNLVDETVHIDVQTASRNNRVMNIGTPITVRGPLSKPVVELDEGGVAVRAVARTARGLVFSPIDSLGDFFKAIGDDGKEPDHPCLAGQ